MRRRGKMGIRIVVPASVRGGFYKNLGDWTLGLMAHSLQCDQVWLFLIRRGNWRFGYRTRGDATPNIATYYNAGWHWPWKFRFTSGRG
jgi:hypothetical protein